MTHLSYASAMICVWMSVEMSHTSGSERVDSNRT